MGVSSLPTVLFNEDWVYYMGMRIHTSSSQTSTTEEEDSEYFSNYLWLFRTRMSMLRRQDLL